MGNADAIIGTIDVKSLSVAEIDALIESLQHEREKKVYERRKSLRAELIEVARAEGYSISELFGANAVAAGRSASTKPDVYRDPAGSGKTWSGHGRRPGWFLAALDAGHDREAMRI